ncbi:MAG: hypothetical protein Q9221_006364 [Calogaya cf. arnoldii]
MAPRRNRLSSPTPTPPPPPPPAPAPNPTPPPPPLQPLFLDIKQVPSIFRKSDQAKIIEALQRIRDKYFFQLDDYNILPSEEAETLKKKKDDRQAAMLKNQRKNIRLKDIADKKKEEAKQAKADRDAELADLADEKLHQIVDSYSLSAKYHIQEKLKPGPSSTKFTKT